MDTEKKRVQFDFNPDAYQRLERMQATMGVPTRAEVLRTSLKVLEWFLQMNPEQIIEIHDGDGKVIYRLPVSALIS